MAPSPSPDLEPLFVRAEAGILAAFGGPPVVPSDDVSGALGERCGAFVTLMVAGELNGCIGTLEATEPLGDSVPRLAQLAAFEDPRLRPLSIDDWPVLRIAISRLGPMEPIPVESLDELVAALRPGVDGVLIAAGQRQSTLLPAVWSHLPDPRAFVAELLDKAGLRSPVWEEGTQVWRYSADEAERPARPLASSSATKRFGAT